METGCLRCGTQATRRQTSRHRTSGAQCRAGRWRVCSVLCGYRCHTITRRSRHRRRAVGPQVMAKVAVIRHHGRRGGNCKAILVKEGFERSIFLSQAIFVLANVGVYLFEAHNFVLQCFDVQFFALSVCSVSQVGQNRAQTAMERLSCSRSETMNGLTSAPADSVLAFGSRRACCRVWDLDVWQVVHLW